MKKIDVILGIDIGGTNTAFGLVDRNGKIYLKDSLPTQPGEGADVFFTRLFTKFGKRFFGKADVLSLKGIGIGAPNGNYYHGIIENPPNLGWGKINVVDLVNKHYSLPAKVTNDANAAALGEMRFGAAKKMNNFIEITLGTGLGSGIVVNGQMLYGHFGNAGELGHINVVPDGRQCNCGRKGCLETYASAEGLRRTVWELLADTLTESTLRELAFNKVSSRQIYDLALQGDPIALQAFEFTGHILGRALADMAAIFAPEAFIFFGGLSLAGDLLFNSVKKYYEKYSLHIFDNKIKILLSALPSGDAAILGAAALLWYEFNHTSL